MSTPQSCCWTLGPGPRCLSPMSSLLPFSHTVKAIRRTDSHSGVRQWIWQWISFTIIEGNSCCHICCNQRSHLMLFTLIVTDTASLLQANLQSGLSSLWVPVASSGSLHLSLPLLFSSMENDWVVKFLSSKKKNYHISQLSMTTMLISAPCMYYWVQKDLSVDTVDSALWLQLQPCWCFSVLAPWVHLEN